MITAKQAKKIALIINKNFTQCREYDKGYYFFANEFEGIVVIKETGNTCAFDQFVSEYNPVLVQQEEPPKNKNKKIIIVAAIAAAVVIAIILFFVLGPSAKKIDKNLIGLWGEVNTSDINAIQFSKNGDVKCLLATGLQSFIGTYEAEKGKLSITIDEAFGLYDGTGVMVFTYTVLGNALELTDSSSTSEVEYISSLLKGTYMLNDSKQSEEIFNEVFNGLKNRLTGLTKEVTTGFVNYKVNSEWKDYSFSEDNTGQAYYFENNDLVLNITCSCIEATKDNPQNIEEAIKELTKTAKEMGETISFKKIKKLNIDGVKESALYEVKHNNPVLAKNEYTDYEIIMYEKSDKCMQVLIEATQEKVINQLIDTISIDKNKIKNAVITNEKNKTDNKTNNTNATTNNTVNNNIIVGGNARVATVNDDLNVRSGPGQENQILGIVKEGALAYVLEISNNWAKVSSTDMLSASGGYLGDGWVSMEFLTVDEMPFSEVPSSFTFKDGRAYTLSSDGTGTVTWSGGTDMITYKVSGNKIIGTFGYFALDGRNNWYYCSGQSNTTETVQAN